MRLTLSVHNWIRICIIFYQKGSNVRTGALTLDNLTLEHPPRRLTLGML